MRKFKADPFPTDTPTSYPTAPMKELFHAIVSLKSTNEAAKFFRDLLTMAEIREFANRWAMVKLLYKGESYLSISKKLKVSTSTVTRVAHWLKNGFGGYKSVADRVLETKFKDSDIPDSYYRTGKYHGIKKPNVL